MPPAVQLRPQGQLIATALLHPEAEFVVGVLGAAAIQNYRSTADLCSVCPPAPAPSAATHFMTPTSWAHCRKLTAHTAHFRLIVLGMVSCLTATKHGDRQ